MNFQQALVSHTDEWMGYESTQEVHGMSVLTRYKRPGGFRQLLSLVETSQPVKQQKLIEVIEKEDPRWAARIRQKKLDPEMVLGWPPEHLVIVFENMTPLHCGNIFKSLGETVLKSYSRLFKDDKYREIKSYFDDEIQPTEHEMTSAHYHMLETIRKLDETKEIELRHIDPSLDISDAA